MQIGFLLIVCTGRIITAESCPKTAHRSSAGYSEFPAYSQILLRLKVNLRTVIVTAAVYRGFGRELRLAANPLP